MRQTRIKQNEVGLFADFKASYLVLETQRARSAVRRHSDYLLGFKPFGANLRFCSKPASRISVKIERLLLQAAPSAPRLTFIPA
jgi:hypothetical protein